MSGPVPGPDSDRAFIERSLRWGIIGATGLAVLLVLLWLLKGALTPLAAAFVLAYLFDPLIDRMEALRCPRGLAIGTLLLLVGVALAAFAVFVVPLMQREIAGLVERLPDYAERVTRRLGPLLASIGVELPGSFREAVDGLREHQLERVLRTAAESLGRVAVFFAGTLGALVGLLVVPVIAYYLTVRFDDIKDGILDLVPRAYQEDVARRARTVDELLSSFIRGQLVVAGILGVLYAAGFAVIGVDLAVVIGAAAGLLGIIPYVGNAIALASASLLCVLEFGVDLHLALVVGWYAIVQTLEGFVLTPRIVGGSVGMHPVTVILALLIGGDLLGFLGLLVAVPVAAVVQVFLRELLAAYRASSLYQNGSEEGSAQG